MQDVGSMQDVERAATDVHVATGRRAVAIVFVALLLGLGGAIVVFLQQITVTDPSLAAARTCGSAFDSAVDRSGWDVWWAQDLDDPDEMVRAALLRTQECPTAVNRHTTLAGLLAGVGSIVAFTSWLRWRKGSRGGTPGSVGRRVARLGSVTITVSGALSLGGLLAGIAVVANAEEGLFRFTDRPTVMLIGLIALLPTLGLVVLGRVLMLLGRWVDEFDEVEKVDDREELHG